MSPPPPPSLDLLRQQNAATSSAIIDYLADHTDFHKLAAYEGHLTVTRDAEDDAKLAQGIALAQSKGVIDPNFVPEPYHEIDVLGQTPDQVADTILAAVQQTEQQQQQQQQQQSDPTQTGKIIVLVGLSGTGKGTTVSKLREKLLQQQSTSNGDNVVTWSNGNIFRAVTLLAVTWCGQPNNPTEDISAALTPQHLAEFMQMLSFEKNSDGHYDTHIQGLGLDLWVSQIQNTELKAPAVSKYIPTVAEVTQGEVIAFAAHAVETLGAHGFVVLLEGRAQTVHYVRSPHRFTLVLSDESLIGKRRAAQRLMAAAAAALVDETPTNNKEDAQVVVKALQTALADMVAQVP